jgi:hypothetical protein
VSTGGCERLQGGRGGGAAPLGLTIAHDADPLPVGFALMEAPHRCPPPQVAIRTHAVHNYGRVIHEVPARSLRSPDGFQHSGAGFN